VLKRPVRSKRRVIAHSRETVMLVHRDSVRVTVTVAINRARKMVRVNNEAHHAHRKPKANVLRTEQRVRRRHNLPAKIVHRANVAAARRVTMRHVQSKPKANVRNLAMAASIRRVSIHAMRSQPAANQLKRAVNALLRRRVTTSVRKAAALMDSDRMAMGTVKRGITTVHREAPTGLPVAAVNAAMTRVHSTTVRVRSGIMVRHRMRQPCRPHPFVVSVRCHQPINVNNLC